MVKKISAITTITLLFILSFWFAIRLNRSNTESKQKTQNQISGNLNSEKSARMPTVSGSFYPADQEELKKEIGKYLDNASRINYSGKPRILIVPHAGITYAGAVAADGFKQIEVESGLRVILLGPSHTSLFDYAALDDSNFWETPLGKTEVDTDFINALNNGMSIKVDKNAHLKEHSLEMQLIFLQTVLTDFKIVPILLSRPSDDLMDLLAQKIAYNFDENTILVVSSDLSHYPNWNDANYSDNLIIDSILTGNADTFDKTVKDIESKNIKALDTTACGKDGIDVALRVSNLLGIGNFEKIKYENSGDVTGDKNRVVGYGSILGTSEELSLNFPEMDEASKEEALNIARETLVSYLSSKKNPDIIAQSSYLQNPLGAFVTLTENGVLRGCMGEFEPVKPLYKVIEDTAIKSATKDPRFQPVTHDELDDIEIEISVMTPKRKLDNWQDIRLGKDGVVIQKGQNAGTFLPQVATDNNWDLETFLRELCSQKSGLPSNCYNDPEVGIYSFEVQVFRE